jgi:hypothetical protein
VREEGIWEAVWEERVPYVLPCLLRLYAALCCEESEVSAKKKSFPKSYWFLGRGTVFICSIQTKRALRPSLWTLSRSNLRFLLFSFCFWWMMMCRSLYYFLNPTSANCSSSIKKRKSLLIFVDGSLSYALCELASEGRRRQDRVGKKDGEKDNPRIHLCQLKPEKMLKIVLFRVQASKLVIFRKRLAKTQN